MYVVRLLQDAESKARARAKRRALTTGMMRSAWTDDDFGGGASASSTEPKYADSRPCWRCLKWMEWAGIKRVFWTDENGVWEGAKVVQLLYGPFPQLNAAMSLSNSSSDADSDTDTSSGGGRHASSTAAGRTPLMHPAIHITRYEQAAIVQAARAAGAAGGNGGGGGGQARRKGGRG